MAEAKQHHLVHKAFQTRFTNDEGRLYFFDRVSPKQGVRKCESGDRIPIPNAPQRTPVTKARRNKGRRRLGGE
jgi:hypothetical protein